MTLVYYGFSTLSCAHENVHQWSPLMIRYTKDSKHSVLSLVILAVQPNSKNTMLLYQIFQRLKMFTSDLPCSPVTSPDNTYYTCCATKFEEVPCFCTKYSRDWKFSSSDLPWCHMNWNRLHGFQLFNVLVSTAQSDVLSLSLSNSLSLLSVRPSVRLSVSLGLVFSQVWLPQKYSPCQIRF